LNSDDSAPPPPLQEEGEEGKKKKKEKLVIPVPPEVATGYLVVRAALASVLGLPVTGTDAPYAGAFQSMFLKDPGTGKFGLALGKRRGEDLATVPLPEQGEGDHVGKLFDAVDAACHAIVSLSAADETTTSAEAPLLIQLCEMTKAQILQEYGSTPLDASHAKLEPDRTLNVARVGKLLVAVPPGTPLASPRGLTVRIDRDQSSVTAGKKARKAEVTVKFRVVVAAAASDVDPRLAPFNASSTPPEPGWSRPEIRLSQGRELKAFLEAAEVTSAATPAVPADAEAPSTRVGAEEEGAEDEMVVNVETVAGKIDYSKLVEQFGSNLLTDDLLDKLRESTSIPLHRFLRRNIFFSHRDVHTLLENVQRGSKFYLYTGRGPSSSAMHLGHLIPFLFTKYLQDAFGVPLVIQMTDDEKFIFKGEYDEENGGYNLEHFQRLTVENAKDIIACGFDYEKTFLFSDMEYVGTMYPNIVRLWKACTVNQVNGCFGFDGSSNAGKVAFPAIQAAPSFATSFPGMLDQDMLCLIPCAIDQDPYFRLTRDVAHKLVPRTHPLGGKPALLHSKFFPPLQGAMGKMSSSDANSAVFLTDTPQDIERKIKAHAFSGGRDTKEKQQELGANLDVDVSYQWLRFFMEDDDELERIGKDYSTGSGEYWSTGAVKKRLVEVLVELVGQHQARRALISDEDVRRWMTPRNLMA
jgi:tryptophanyl-tRNA synthetase